MNLVGGPGPLDITPKIKISIYNIPILSPRKIRVWPPCFQKFGPLHKKKKKKKKPKSNPNNTTTQMLTQIDIGSVANMH